MEALYETFSIMHSPNFPLKIHPAFVLFLVIFHFWHADLADGEFKEFLMGGYLGLCKILILSFKSLTLNFLVTVARTLDFPI